MSLQRKIKSLRIISSLAQQLSIYKVPDAEASVRILLEHSIVLANRAKFKSTTFRHKRAYPPALAVCYAIRLLQIRRYHYPIQYMIGEWLFRQLTLKVKPPILIPRYQTEHLIGQAIKSIKSKWKNGSQIKFIDLGCGTGAIGLSLIKQLQEEYKIHGILLDLNPTCLDLVMQNALKNNIDSQKMTLVCDDMRRSGHLIEQCQIVISNPPYLSTKHHGKLQKQVKLYEAHSALVGGQDGLDYVRFLVTQIQKQKRERPELMCFIQYGGEDVSPLGVQKHVKVDQYGRRRYIFFH